MASRQRLYKSLREVSCTFVQINLFWILNLITDSRISARQLQICLTNSARSLLKAQLLQMLVKNIKINLNSMHVRPQCFLCCNTKEREFKRTWFYLIKKENLAKNVLKVESLCYLWMCFMTNPLILLQLHIKITMVCQIIREKSNKPYYFQNMHMKIIWLFTTMNTK